MNGLNFMLSYWLPCFDPYSTCIDMVDQWVRVARLPWEFWEYVTLVNLLKPVGEVIKVDQTTLLRLNGKFDRVCDNIDVIEPLPGSLVISFKGKSMKVPLIYEGLYEVCALCGSESHQIEACLNLLANSKVEIVVKKFGGGSGQAAISVTQASSFASEPVTVTDKWIRVSPKKLFRSMPSSGVGKSSPLKAPLLPKVTIVEPVLSPVLSPKVFGSSTETEAQDKSSSATHKEGIFLAHPAQ